VEFNADLGRTHDALHLPGYPGIHRGHARRHPVPGLHRGHPRRHHAPGLHRDHPRRAPRLTHIIRAATTLPDYTEAIRAAIAAVRNLDEQWDIYDLSFRDPNVRRSVQAVVSMLVFAITLFYVAEHYEAASAIGTLLGLNPVAAAQFAWWLVGVVLKHLGEGGGSPAPDATAN
jgi:hypothetical protein